jgi:A/G-specific adenine glycosylase
VLVSEVMLQQTQAVRVVPAYRRFIELFPTVEALANASRSDVVRAWDGLGYNRRAVALSEAARAIVREHGGRVPSDPALLKRLPGVGPYTAAAVASLAFGVAVATVDTNVRRVVARARLGREPDEVRPRDIDDEAERWLDRRRPDRWNQALMDLGRYVCRPRPACDGCPLRLSCRFRNAERRPPTVRRATTPFDGSRRQVRGAIVRVLRHRRSASVRGLAAETGLSIERVVEAIDGLVRDGLVVKSERDRGATLRLTR